MRCSRAHELISDALDARLGESDGIGLARHLEGCVDCQKHQTVLERGRVALRGQLIEPSENFEWKVQLKIQQALRESVAVEEPVQGWHFWRPALASASAVAAVVVIAGLVLMGGPGGKSLQPGAHPAGEFLAESGPVSPSSGVVAEAATPVPDLSGAVRSTPLKINTANGGFGIRTVADRNFVRRSPWVRDVPQDSRWIQEEDGAVLEMRQVVAPDGSTRILLFQHRAPAPSAGLHLDPYQRNVHREPSIPGTVPERPDTDS